ncbi:MAG: cellulase family glycosylhydrolase, partial [Proteobacteria bacterium]|nr:cellulase family glycosylhydrolase [Pseudomonadota bacterium]
EFMDPDGAVHTMPGYITRDYDRSLVGGFEKLAVRNGLHWKVRFTPDRPGTWHWRWIATLNGDAAATPWRELEVDPPSPDRHGFLRVSDDDPRYLEFDDDSPYFAVGENLSWYDGRGTFAYDDWLAKLADRGVNYVRLWMPSWAFGIEWGGLGDYRNRLDRAWQLDRVLEAAEAHGIYVMLCIQNHGPFSLGTNSQWADNPYNAANGGPLAAPTEFFTNPEARALFKRRLRYVVARWGGSTHLLAWELWNEVNLVANTADPDVLAWHTEMADELRRLDPHDHPITTSTSASQGEQLWQLPAIEITQTHAYAWPFFYDFGEFLPLLMQSARVPGKPTLLSEYGTDFRGPAETLAGDPESIGFHDGLWAGVMAGAFGTGMTWWWDNVVDPEDLYSHFGAVSAFVEGVAFHREGFVRATPVAEAAGRNLLAHALLGTTVHLVWLKNTDHQWFPEGGSGDPVPVEGARITLEGIADGEWSVRWIDTLTGEDVAGQVDRAAAANGALELAAPAFVGDLALRLGSRAEP